MEFTRCLLTLTEMLSARGHDTAALTERDDLLKKYGEGTAFAVTVPSAPSAQGGAPLRIVFYPQVTGPNTKDIRKALDGDGDPPAHDYLIVLHTRATDARDGRLQPNVVKAAQEMQAKLSVHGRHMQLFTFAELQYNVMRHGLQPRFEKLTQGEVEQLMRDYALKSTGALQRFLPDDKVARFMGLRAGDVVRVTRNSPAGDSVSYRAY